MPLKLGVAHNVIDYWSFIEIFDLEPLVLEYRSLIDSYKTLNHSLHFEKYSKQYKQEMHNFQYLLDHVILEAGRKFKQIIPEITFRKKRALINVLGSIIRAITGNLDQTDALKFETAISQLSKNQQSIKYIMKEQISLTLTAIEKFNKTLSSLSHNQRVLETRLMQIENIVKNVELKTIETHELLLFNTVFNQLITAINAIIRILENLGNAITFAKQAILHPSILEPEDLLFEINKVAPYLSQGKLPFNTKIENIFLYEKIAKIKAYQKDFKIIFIVEIPIVESKPYNHYHLYSFPSEVGNNLFQIIVPNNKFLYLNEQSYCLTNSNCEEVRPGEALCQLPSLYRINGNSPCEIQLLHYSRNYSNCHIKHFKMFNKKIQEIHENQWIAVIPNETTISIQCQENRENQALKGSYIIKLPEDCSIKIEEINLQIYQDPIVQRKVAKLPTLVPPEVDQSAYNEMLPIELEQIELDGMQSIKENLKRNDKKLDLISEPNIHYQTTSIYTILLYILLLIGITYIIIKKWPWRFNKVPESPSMEMANSIDEINLRK